MEQTKKRKWRGWQKGIAVFLAVLFSLTAFAFVYAEISFRTSHRWQQWKPNYAKKDLTEVLSKKSFTEEDYALLYEQTGLTKLGVDGLKREGRLYAIYEIQEDYFGDYGVWHEEIAPYTCIERSETVIRHCAVEPGDIVVSDTTHVCGWRLGHAALILNKNAEILEAFSVGTVSQISYISSFTSSASFIILRPRIDIQKRQEIVDSARKNLLGVPYSLFPGLLSKKAPKKLKNTQCAHLVWYAYYQFGFDIDSSGGALVTPRDIANSPLLDVVQVYGFNPNTLWK